MKFIEGIKSETDVAKIKENLGENVIIKDSNGNIINDDTNVATGFTIDLIHRKKVIDTVKVVVKGDTDGSGTIDVLDMESIQKDILGIGDGLVGAYMEAAKLTDNNVISVLDMESIQKHILGLECIEN